MSHCSEVNHSELMDSKFLKYMAERGRKPDATYEGMYHHLNVNWGPLFSDREAMTALITDALDVVSFEERREFIAQMVWRILDGGDALERLLLAAFGQQENAKC